MTVNNKDGEPVKSKEQNAFISSSGLCVNPRERITCTVLAIQKTLRTYKTSIYLKGTNPR